MICETITPVISPIKRGDTFTLACTYKQNGVAFDVTLFTIRSQVRDSSGALVEELTATKANQTTNPGVFVLSAADPMDWPVDVLSCDIQFSDSEGDVRSTQPFQIPVVEDVTHD
jgi:hypothetical protein